MSNPLQPGCLYGIDEDTRQDQLRRLRRTASEAWLDHISGEGLDYLGMNETAKRKYSKRRQAFMDQYNGGSGIDTSGWLKNEKALHESYSEWVKRDRDRERHAEATIVSLQGQVEALLLDYRQLFMRAAKLEAELKQLRGDE
jgi:hypothetical protein